MGSSIDAAKPVAGSPTTASVRANFAAAKSEIEALQTAVAGKQAATPVLAALAAMGADGGLVEQTGGDGFAKRAIGVSAGTSIPTRGHADGRYLQLAGGAIGGDLAVSGSLTISGSLTVNGTTTTVDSTTVTTADNLIVINSGEIGAGVTAGSAGIEVDRGSAAAYRFLFDEASDAFKIGEAGSLQKVATREDAPAGGKFARWNDSAKRFDTAMPLESLVIAVSDEATAIAAGTAKVTFRMPYAFTLTVVRASLTAASSAGAVTVDVNEGGTSLFGTNKLSIDAGEKTSVTAAVAASLSDTSLADDAELTIDIDAAGTGAKGLKVTLIGRQS